MGIVRNVLTASALTAALIVLIGVLSAHEPRFAKVDEIGELIDRLESDRVVERSLRRIVAAMGETEE